jgi:predicted nucleic acid-binding protein
MVFIYFIEQTEPYFQLCNKILHLSELGQFKTITSTVSLLECLATSKYLLRPDIQNEIIGFFENNPGLNIIPADKYICVEAARLRRENLYLKTPDSIQLATAIVCEADFFITHDTKLTKLNLPLKIISL